MNDQISKPILITGPVGPLEDSIVGNRQGLEELSNAIHEALKDGESQSGVGEFGPVYLKPDDWFPPDETTTSILGSIAFFTAVAALLTLLVIGGYTIFSWI